MSDHARRVLPPSASRKRKEREPFGGPRTTKPLVQVTAVGRTTEATTLSKGSEPQPLSSNRLLAGYMAYEFLTNGTLFGENYDPVIPARAAAASGIAAESRRGNNEPNIERGQPSAGAEPKAQSKPHGYAEVANLLKSDGVHIPEVVNPTQLARWIQM